MNITCHACARTWEIEDDATSAACAFCGRQHDADMIATSRAAAAIGKLGGRSTSTAKAAAAAANGRKSAGRPSLRAQAERRVIVTPELCKHSEFIMADWREGAEHWRWIISAPVAEIVEWAEAGQ